MFKKLFSTPKRMKVVLTHNQKHNISEAIKLHKMKAVYKKYGYEIPQ